MWMSVQKALLGATSSVLMLLEALIAHVWMVMSWQEMGRCVMVCTSMHAHGCL